jgi:hypothetical protein
MSLITSACSNKSNKKIKRSFIVGDLVKYLGPQGWIHGAIVDKYTADASFDCVRIYIVHFICGRKMEIPKGDPWLTHHDQDADEFLFEGWLTESKYNLAPPTTNTGDCDGIPDSGCCTRCQNFFYPL